MDYKEKEYFLHNEYMRRILPKLKCQTLKVEGWGLVQWFWGLRVRGQGLLLVQLCPPGCDIHIIMYTQCSVHLYTLLCGKVRGYPLLLLSSAPESPSASASFSQLAVILQTGAVLI